MLKSSEIAEQRFEKVSKGYRIDDVDEFLSQVAADYASLQEMNADLERKLEIVADKLEEYRQSEDSLRTVLLGAQKLGDNIVREAKAKAEVMTQESGNKATELISDAEARAEMIVNEAREKAENMITDAQKEMQKDSETLAALNKEVSGFKQKLLSIYREHLELISQLTDDNEVGEVGEAIGQELSQRHEDDEEMIGFEAQTVIDTENN